MALMGAFFLAYHERHGHAETGLMFVYLVMLPFSRYGHTHRRRARVEREALFPVARAQLVRELGMASALDILASWFCLCLATLALRTVGLFGTVSWGSIPYLMSLSLGTTLLGIGISPWFLRLNGDKLPSLLLSFLVLIVGVCAVLPLRSSVGYRAWEAWLSVVLVLSGLGVLGSLPGVSELERSRAGAQRSVVEGFSS